MPDLQTNAPDTAADPLAKLHKMSTTAGLGSGDYVAVNVPAVVTALFGFASILARLNNALLVIPIAGVVCGLVALRQIGRSNGTQTGRGIALAGLLLCLGIGGWVIASQVTSYVANRADEQQISSLIGKWGETIKTQKHQEGYALFGGVFPGRVPFERYRERLAFFENPQVKKLWGDLQGTRWNGHTQFEKDQRTGELQAATFVLAKFTLLPDEHRYSIYFRKLPQGWVIENIPDLFPDKDAPPPGAGGPPGARPGMPQ